MESMNVVGRARHMDLAVMGAGPDIISMPKRPTSTAVEVTGTAGRRKGMVVVDIKMRMEVTQGRRMNMEAMEVVSSSMVTEVRIRCTAMKEAAMAVLRMVM
jgi:hypothetical protein